MASVTDLEMVLVADLEIVTEVDLQMDVLQAYLEQRE